MSVLDRQEGKEQQDMVWSEGRTKKQGLLPEASRLGEACRGDQIHVVTGQADVIASQNKPENLKSKASQGRNKARQ